MTRRTLALTLAAILVAVVAIPALGQGTARGRYYTKADVEKVIKRLENHTDEFRKAVDRDLDRSVFNGKSREDRLNDQVEDLEKATDRLRDKFDRSDRWEDTKDNVQDVLREARDINDLFNRWPAYSKVKTYWVAVKTDANTLAGIYNLRKIP